MNKFAILRLSALLGELNSPWIKYAVHLSRLFGAVRMPERKVNPTMFLNGIVFSPAQVTCMRRIKRSADGRVFPGLSWTLLICPCASASPPDAEDAAGLASFGRASLFRLCLN